MIGRADVWGQYNERSVITNMLSYTPMSKSCMRIKPMSETINEWPDYNTLTAMLAAANTPFSAAYIHGMMSGQLCTDMRLSPKIWEDFLDEMPALKGLAAENELLNKLFMLTANHLEEAPGAMILILPEDNAPLSSRLSALSDWCNGFLEGIVLDNAALKLPIVQEALADLANIKEVATQTKSSKSNEASYVEVVEFIRVAVLLIHAECQPITQGNGDPFPIH